MILHFSVKLKVEACLNIFIFGTFDQLAYLWLLTTLNTTSNKSIHQTCRCLQHVNLPASLAWVVRHCDRS